MPPFKTALEKRYWSYALFIYVAILSSIVLGAPFQKWLWGQEVQLVLFLLGMLLTGITLLVFGLRLRPGKTELILWLGFAAIGVLLMFRLGAAERSHLMEYGVLAIFIYKALSERRGTEASYLVTALLAFVITSLLGALDEGIQSLVPQRVFDPEDILFNILAAFLATGGSLVINWARKKLT